MSLVNGFMPKMSCGFSNELYFALWAEYSLGVENIILQNVETGILFR